MTDIAIAFHRPPGGAGYHAARSAMQRGAKGILSDYLFYELTPDRTRERLARSGEIEL